MPPDEKYSLNYSKPVILVGPAEVDIAQVLKFSQYGFAIVAADGGANALLRAGIKPDAIIGDMDSFEPATKELSDIKIFKIDEQDSTDFEKCLTHIEAPLFLALGFSGNRFDHTLANLHVMTKYHDRKSVILLTHEDLSFVHSGEFECNCQIGQVFSVFPLTPIQFMTSRGLIYPLDGLNLGLGKMIGTSNETRGEKVQLIPGPDHQETPYLITLQQWAIEQFISKWI